MSRLPRPWFRSNLNTWYATINGEQTSLHVQGRDNEPEAWFALFKLMQEREANDTPEELAAERLCQRWLDTIKEQVKANTHASYTWYLKRWMKSRQGTAMEITPDDVARFAARQQWSLATRQTFIIALKMAYKWACKRKLIPSNPIEDLTVGTIPSRGSKCLITPEQYKLLLSSASPAMAQFLELLWETGARPHEIASIQAHNLDRHNKVVRLLDHKTARHRTVRTIVLTDRALTILTELAERYPSGCLVRADRGGAFNHAVRKARMTKLSRRCNLPNITLYSFRHSYATRLLASGVPDAVVAELLGHTGTKTLHRHYNHLGSQFDTLRAWLKQAGQD